MWQLIEYGEVLLYRILNRVFLPLFVLGVNCAVVALLLASIVLEHFRAGFAFNALDNEIFHSARELQSICAAGVNILYRDIIGFVVC